MRAVHSCSSWLEIVKIPYMTQFRPIFTSCINLDCGIPPSPDNGKVVSNSSMDTKYGATALQSCDQGYDQSGIDTIYCQNDATWSQSINCTIKGTIYAY